MCELLAMSANRPAEVGRYLSRLMPRGGLTGPHADGWGVAYYEGRAARVFKDPAPAAESRFLAMLAEQPLKSTAVIAHIRRANPAVFGRATANTHPFEREWNGRSWVFARNGKLPGLHDQRPLSDSRFQPLGDTDSELAFCRILDAIARGIGRRRDFTPATLANIIGPVVAGLAALGEFNFILGDGECLYVHAHTNLHLLNISRPVEHGAEKMCLLATAPLTAEPWRALAPHTIHVISQGEEVLRPRRSEPARRCWTGWMRTGAGSAAPPDRRPVAGGHGLHGAEHGVVEPRRGEPSPRARAAAPRPRDRLVPAAIRGRDLGARPRALGEPAS